jgi:hypothetical protein
MLVGSGPKRSGPRESDNIVVQLIKRPLHPGLERLPSRGATADRHHTSTSPERAVGSYRTLNRVRDTTQPGGWCVLAIRSTRQLVLEVNQVLLWSILAATGANLQIDGWRAPVPRRRHACGRCRT